MKPNDQQSGTAQAGTADANQSVPRFGGRAGLWWTRVLPGSATVIAALTVPGLSAGAGDVDGAVRLTGPAKPPVPLAMGRAAFRQVPGAATAPLDGVRYGALLTVSAGSVRAVAAQGVADTAPSMIGVSEYGSGKMPFAAVAAPINGKATLPKPSLSSPSLSSPSLSSPSPSSSAALFPATASADTLDAATSYTVSVIDQFVAPPETAMAAAIAAPRATQGAGAALPATVDRLDMAASYAATMLERFSGLERFAGASAPEAAPAAIRVPEPTLPDQIHSSDGRAAALVPMLNPALNPALSPGQSFAEQPGVVPTVAALGATPPAALPRAPGPAPALTPQLATPFPLPPSLAQSLAPSPVKPAPIQVQAASAPRLSAAIAAAAPGLASSRSAMAQIAAAPVAAAAAAAAKPAPLATGLSASASAAGSGSGGGSFALDITAQLVTRVDGKAAGTVDFQQTATGLTVRLGSIAAVLGDRFAPAEIARIAASSASNTYLSLAQLQAQGIPISYDPVYDEFNVGTSDTRPKAARKVHIDQISAPERGLGSTALDQVTRR